MVIPLLKCAAQQVFVAVPPTLWMLWYGPAAAIAIRALLFDSANSHNAAMDWDDLRFVLATSRTGSALGAAQRSLNQTTVVRRIAHIEKTIGADLFERKQSGYDATALGHDVAATAELIEAHIQSLQIAIAAGQRKLTGVVRLTMSERLARSVLAPSLLSFQTLHPGVRIELITEDRRLDIARGEADVALRAGSHPEGVGIVIRKLPPVAWSVYCSHGYAAKRGAPATHADLAHHSIIGMDGPMEQLPGPLWLLEAAPMPTSAFVATASPILSQISAPGSA